MHSGLILARGLTKMVVGGSVARVTAEIIKNNVKHPETRKEKIRLVVATAALGGIAADFAKERVHKEFDEIVEFVNKIKGGELQQEIKDTWAQATEENKEPTETLD